MTGILKSLCLAAALFQLCHANLDIITLRASTDAYIQEVTATLVVGDVPNPMTGDVALWSAIMTDKADFLQGVTENANPR